MADTAGIGAITLRSVAARLSLPLATLQRDFGSRDRLVAAMAQHVFTSPQRSAVTHEDPVGALIDLAEREWRTYQAHPWLVQLMASTRPPLVPAVLNATGTTIEVFTTMGLDAETALERYLALNSYIQGMALLLLSEREELARTGTTGRRWWGQELGRLDRTGVTRAHPWLAELAEYSADRAFDVGRCFRAGLRRMVASLVDPAPV